MCKRTTTLSCAGPHARMKGERRGKDKDWENRKAHAQLLARGAGSLRQCARELARVVRTRGLSVAQSQSIVLWNGRDETRHGDTGSRGGKGGTQGEREQVTETTVIDTRGRPKREPGAGGQRLRSSLAQQWTPQTEGGHKKNSTRDTTDGIRCDSPTVQGVGRRIYEETRGVYSAVPTYAYASSSSYLLCSVGARLLRLIVEAGYMDSGEAGVAMAPLSGE